MKKVVYHVAFTGLIIVLNSCAVGYVETEPTYVAVARSAPPEPTYVWIEGNWVWDSKRRSYYHTDGYWVKPKKGRVYVEGHWSKGPRGYYWNRGRWK